MVASGCDRIATTTFNPCSDPGIGIEELALGALTCPSPPAASSQRAVEASGGAFTLVGGPVSLAMPGSTSGTYSLSGSSQGTASAGRDLGAHWTNVIGWPATSVVVRSGLQEVMQ